MPFFKNSPASLSINTTERCRIFVNLQILLSKPKNRVLVKSVIFEKYFNCRFLFSIYDSLLLLTVGFKNI